MNNVNLLDNFQERFIKLSIYFYLAYYMLPFLSVVLPGILKYFVLAIIFAGSIVSLYTDKSKVVENSKLLIVILGFILVLYLGKWKISGMGFVSYFTNAYLFWCSFLFMIPILKMDSVTKKKMLNFFLILTFITMITTIKGCIESPNASRLLATGSNREYEHYFRQNIGGYGFVYSLVLLLPFVFYIKKETTHKIIYWIFVVVLIYTVIITQFNYAIMSVIVLFILMLVFSGSKNYISIVIALLMISVVLIFRDNIFALLDSVVNYFESIDMNLVADRFESVINIFSDNVWEGDALVRSNLYTQSRDAFFANPLFGNLITPNPQIVGGHSEFLDILGSTGLLGMAMFLFPLFIHFKGLKDIKDKNLLKASVFSVCLFVFIASVNTVLTSGAVGIAFFMIPSMVRSSENIGMS